ncbi:MAG: Rrf2 family transcriptional regulator [Clostridia bacterium]|nr:Rrf2 family transcriptional regulator [Clostridia bacterium]
MKLSTKARYGLKAMVDIAMQDETGDHVSVATLARSQGISESYLEQIIGKLKKAGLIMSARGAQGGYRLSFEPEEISVYSILNAVEDTNLVDCVSVDEQAVCKNACTCSVRPLWLKLQSRINAVLLETTLKDMAEDYKFQMERSKLES